MGLSDEERLAKMYWSAKYLYELGCDLQKSSFEHKEPLSSLCKQVWTKLLGKDNNSGYWILGGALANSVTDTTNGWAIALASKFNDVHSERQDVRFGTIRDSNKDFDPFDGFLNIRGLILNNSTDYTMVYDIYAYTENMIYALRRYEDEFLKRFLDLSNLISEIQGVCFGIFTTNDLYAKAYLANQIFEKKFYANDTIKRLAEKDHWHHHYSLILQWSLDEIMRLHKELFNKEPTLHSLIKYSLITMGRRYHYKHSFDALIKDLEQLKDPSININNLRVIWKEKCFEAHEANEKKNMDMYSKNKDIDKLYIIHGFDDDEGFFEDREKPHNSKDPKIKKEKKKV
jgi:hypothetical protein